MSTSVPKASNNTISGAGGVIGLKGKGATGAK